MTVRSRWEDAAAQRVDAFAQQFTQHDRTLLYRHRGVGPAYKVSADQRARWTAEFSDKIYASHRRIMFDAVLMMVSLVISIQLFGDGHATTEYAIGVSHLVLLALFETYKERAAWHAPLGDLKGHPPFILGGGFDAPPRWYDRVDGLAGQSTTKLLAGLVGGLFAIGIGISPNARDNLGVAGVHPMLMAGLYVAVGSGAVIAATIILVRRWQRR